MKHINIDGVQNVEVSRKIPPAKSPMEQLELMEKYTSTYQQYMDQDKAIREVRCLQIIYPALFRPLKPEDRIAGRLDFLPIGFGCVTSVGGVGHYCVFHKLRALKDELPANTWSRVDALYEFWQHHDVKTLYCQQALSETTGRFIDCSYPLMATARLSGMMLDYKKLIRLGLPGLRREIETRFKETPNAYLWASLEMLDLFEKVIDYQIVLVGQSQCRDQEQMKKDLHSILSAPPATFRQALQLFWLYALCAGCINYGRLDDLLGPYLQEDLESGRLNEEQALQLLESLWMLIENRRTTVNGRIITGGRGRENPEAADLFTRLCLQVVRKLRVVEPQFTLRFDASTPADVLDLAYTCLAEGATYPTLYNDDVNIPAVMYAMQVDEQTAEQYVPFGCGEFVIQGQSVGTPNTLLNLVKILQMAMNQGIDPMDGSKKCGPVSLESCEKLSTWEKFWNQYTRLLNWFMMQSARLQKDSYELMNQEVSFLFASALMDDCLGKGKALLDGGVRILGGTNETYGNINAGDALYAVKSLVYDQHKYSLEEIRDACLADYEGYEELRQEILDLPKYGNDQAGVDEMNNLLYEYVAKGVRNAGRAAGMDYFLIVISNNQTNTDWGLQTAASPDGRKSGVYLNPANNPQGGAAKSGPTAVLNSLCRFDARYHGGSVQNIKFTPRMMKQDAIKVKALFRTYFKKGGCQLMVTVVDHGMLEDAQLHPQNYPDLIVRVAGYSARFTDLSREVQDELLSRALYD